MDLFTPMQELGPLEEAQPGTFGAAAATLGLPKLRNCAEDDGVRYQIIKEVLPIIMWTRQARYQLEEEWKAIRRMSFQKHDDGQRYLGRTQAYLPIHSRVLGTLVSSLGRGLFPSDDYMDVVDRQSGDPERAKAPKALLQWEFETNGQIRRYIKPFLRQFADFGNSVVKFGYKKKVVSEGRISASKNLFSGFNVDPYMQQMCEEGLTISPRNIFNWYIYPMTAESMREAQLVFEDLDVPVSYILEMKRKKRWANIDAAMSAMVQEKDTKESEHLSDAAGISNDHPFGDNEMGGSKTLTEVWGYMVLPKDQYLPGEEHGAPLPVRIILAGTVPVLVTRNPHFHQRPPYLDGRQSVDPGFYYGSGQGRLTRWLQYLANDMANQLNDVCIYGLNPIVKVNPGMIAGPLPPIAPGVPWYMTDPNGAVFDRPPIEQVQYGQSLFQSYLSMGQEFSFAPPILQGVGGTRGGKTATQAQLMQKNAMGPIQDVVEDLELDVLVPLMKGTWLNSLQFRDQKVIAMVAGRPIEVTPEQLIGDWDMMWLASSQAMNQQLRAQQMMQLIQMVAPVVPFLMQQGKIVDFAPLINKIYTDGMGFRDFHNFIRDAASVPGGGIPRPDQMQGVQAEQGDRIRSTLEQAAGGGDEMQAGEGDEFANVRQGADQMSALAGMMGGVQ